MRKIVETAMILFGTMGWWGFVYPELCLLESGPQESVCEQEESVCEQKGSDSGQEESVCEQEQPESSFGIVVSVPSGTDGQEQEIRIKSKLAEYICEIKEDKAAEKEVENDKQKRTRWGF